MSDHGGSSIVKFIFYSYDTKVEGILDDGNWVSLFYRRRSVVLLNLVNLKSFTKLPLHFLKIIQVFKIGFLMPTDSTVYMTRVTKCFPTHAQSTNIMLHSSASSKQTSLSFSVLVSFEFLFIPGIENRNFT